MAYVVVLSLKHTIEFHLYNPSYNVLVPAFREILEFAYKQVESLEKIAIRVPRNSRRWFVKEIIDAAQKIDNAIGSHLPMEFVSQSESRGDRWAQFSTVNVQRLRQEIDSFTERLKTIEMKMEGCAKELYPLPEEEEEEDDDDVSSRNDSGGHKSKMVGLSNGYDEVKRQVIGVPRSTATRFVTLVGMPGIGKTTLAKKIFGDSDIMESFECLVWVPIGRKCQLKEIPRRILAQLNRDNDQKLAKEDKDVAAYLKGSLKGKRFLIVLDDVWDRHISYHLKTSVGYDELGSHFPDEKNGSRVLLTTRLQVDEDSPNNNVYTMRLLNKEESWDLLRKKVFGEESCPSQLEKAGKKIAEHCDGLPLTIVTVAYFLSEPAKMTPQYWIEVAAKKDHQLFTTAYDEISEVLLPSYKFLPQLLQMCFLYMVVFPQNYEIPQSKLINMWNVDGFLKQNAHEFSDHDAIECLEELVSNNLVMAYHSTKDRLFSRRLTKTCGLHSSLWHLSRREATKNKFSHVLTSRNDGLGEVIKRQHRLSFHNNVLFGIKEVYKSVEDNCEPTAHSLLCYGPYHQYQVPVCFNLTLLWQLDALAIRFYEFPIEVLRLVHLRYLALTLNGEIPASISQLSNLQFLIVGRHLRIKSCRDPLYLPDVIWDMKKLKHLQVMGSDLPDPCGTFLESLSTLSNVSVHCCTEAVLKAIPNLEKLGIQIESASSDGDELLNCFDHISHLKRLKSLKCVIVNPVVVPRLAPLSIFPSHLERLSLSGLGCPWKEMSKIASLPFLRVLKLRNYAFRGPKWEVEKRGFRLLTSLVIEDTDLMEWKFGRESFGFLESLSIKHCYRLEKIEGPICEMFLEKIELVDCNPLGVEQMKKAASNGAEGVHSSCADGRSTSYYSY